MRGTYVRGWKFSWEDAKKDFDAYMASDKPIAAAHCADPGIVACPACGETHWREFEVFLCLRCGAEVNLNFPNYGKETAGPPAKPEMIRQKYYDGMKVKWNPKQKEKRGKTNQGDWKAGKVPIGTLGVVRRHPTTVYETNFWHIIWEGVQPKGGWLFGEVGVWVDDNLEVVS